MESKNSHGSRSEHAQNEKRDSQGRFESKDQTKHPQGSSTEKSSSTDHRGSNAKDEKRDSNGRFESKDQKK